MAVTRRWIREAMSSLAAPMVRQQRALERPLQLLLLSVYRERAERHRAPVDAEDVGFNCYSQTFEDGILLYLFASIGMGSRRFVDIGCGPIHGSNTVDLTLNHGFTGVLLDVDPRHLDVHRRYYQERLLPGATPPRLVRARATAENVNALLADNDMTGEIDLLSIDIDGMDYWIWKAIDVVRPRIVIIEYQDSLGPERSWTVPYDPEFDAGRFTVNARRKTYCGASLRAMLNLATAKDYRLVGCNAGGWNAFFVARGVAEDLLPEIAPERCFRFAWNQHGAQHRFPLVKDLPWETV